MANMQDVANPAQEGDAYPTTSRMIDAGAFLLLASAIFMPIVRLQGQFAFLFQTVELVERFDVALLVGGATLAGLLAALAKYRRIALISALVYGGVVALFVVNYYKTTENLGPYYVKFFHLDWGCSVIALGVLAVLCSTVIVHRLVPSPRGTSKQPPLFEAQGLYKGTSEALRTLAKKIPVPAWFVVGLIVLVIVVFNTSDWIDWLGDFSALAFLGFLSLLLLGVVSKKLGWKAVSGKLIGRNTSCFDLGESIPIWVVGVLIVSLIGFMISSVLTFERAEPCLSDWAKCTDNDQVVLEYRREIAPQCKHEAIQRSRYGNPVFPSYSFATYKKGKSYLSNGTAILFETDAQFPDASGAMVHSTVTCTYDLRAKCVVDIGISAELK
jgi:hypothetical protein